MAQSIRIAKLHDLLIYEVFVNNNRELEPIEKAIEIMNRHGGTMNVVTVMRFTGFINEKIVRHALNLLQRRHPRLHSRIVKASGSLHFETEGTQQIPLRIVKKVSKQTWQNVISLELNQTIDSSKVLMRAVLIPPESTDSESYLITTIHHAIVDGLSSIKMHQDLLTYMQKIVCGEQITQVDSLSPLPPIGQLLPKSMQGWTGQLKAMSYWSRLVFKYLSNIPETLKLEKLAPINLRRCGWVTVQLDKELTRRFINLCRQEKVTVQGALCAALMFATAKKSSLENRKDICVSCNSYVDLRKHLSPVASSDNMGVLASWVITWHTIKSNTSFWELARDVKQQLNTSLKSDDIYSVVLMSHMMLEYYLAWPNQGIMTADISNIGRVNIPRDYGKFKLEEISFMVGAALAVSNTMCVTTFEEKMILNFTYPEPLISRETVENIANQVLYYLSVDSGVGSERLFEKYYYSSRQ